MHSSIFIFELALGNFEFDSLDESTKGSFIFNRIFLASATVVNLLILLNLIIAIMSNTYTTFSLKSDALYFNEVVIAIPEIKTHKRWGFLNT